MPLAPRLTVSAHLDRCPACRRDVSLFENVGGRLLETLSDAPLEPGALDRAFQAMDRLAPEVPAVAAEVKLIAGVTLPAPLAAVGLHRRRWLGPDVWTAKARAPEAEGWRTFLVSLPAGGHIPSHCHRGGELICVLKGSYSDGDIWRHAGDFAQAENDIEHEIRISPDGPCISMISTQAPIRWRGWAKLLHPILGL